jgi:hypothetical protein
MTLDEACTICEQYALSAEQAEVYAALSAVLDVDTMPTHVDLYPVLTHLYTDAMLYAVTQGDGLAPEVICADLLGMMEQLFLAKQCLVEHTEEEPL